MAPLEYVIVQSPLSEDSLTDQVSVSYGSVSPGSSNLYLLS